MAGIIEVKDQGKLRIYDADNSHYIDIVVPSSVTANRTITIPDASFTVPQADTNTFYTHPNHSGEVTSSADGATVIADNIVDEANLKVSNSAVNGYMLTAQSGNTGGLTWAEAGGGKILQVVQGTDTNFRTTTSSSYASLTLNASITPASSSNKILVIVAAAFGNSGGNAFFDIQKSTDGGSSYSSLGGGDGFGERIDNAGFTPGALMTLNGAGTTNAINYKIFGKQSGGITAKLGAGGYSVIMLLEVAA